MAAWVPEEGHRLVHVAPALTFPLSFQPQHSHLVIQQLLGHLDANSKSAATVRAGIVEVLSEAAVIAASGSVGRCTDPSSPSVLLPVCFGGRCEELLEVWCAPGCEPVLGDLVRSFEESWGSVGCHFSAPEHDTHVRLALDG